MKNSFDDLILEKKEIQTVQSYLIKLLKRKIESDYYYEPIIQTTIFNFIDDFEKKVVSPKSTKSKSDLAWEKIRNDFGISKFNASKKLNIIIKDNFKRHTILRDIGNSFALESLGFYKEAVILSGSVLEEILHLYIHSKNLPIKSHTFNEYVRICEDNNLFKKGINKLTDFVREFRNLVHLSMENSKKDTINKPIAKSAVNSIFSFINEI